MANEKRLDLIDRNALFPNKVLKVKENTPTALFEAVWLALMNAPTVDAVEVVHSEWTFNDNGSGTCGHCHFTQRGVWDQDRHQNYCGVCGAKMDGKREDGVGDA